MSAQQHPKGILISSLSKKAPLIQAVKEAAEQVDPHYILHGCDSDADCIGRYFVDFFWQLPSLSEESFKLTTDYCKYHAINAIIPTRDGELEFFASHAGKFAEHGISVMVSPLKTIQSCLDKQLFADVLFQRGYPAIATSSDINAIDSSVFVVKEQFGAGAHLIGLKLSKDSVIAHASQLHNPLFQPFIEGEEFSVDVFRDRLGNVKGSIARKRNKIVDGESQVTTTMLKPELENLCIQLAADLDIYGHAIFQVIESKDRQLHIVECNPRFGGASTASIQAGLSSFFWFLMECNGSSLENHPFKRIKGEIKQVRYSADKIIRGKHAC